MTIIASERDLTGSKWTLQRLHDEFVLDCPNRIEVRFTAYRERPVPLYPRRNGFDVARIEKRSVPDGVLGTIREAVPEKEEE